MGIPIMTLDDVIELKEFVRERFGVDVHYHDTCGGQSFEVAEMTPDIQNYLTGFFDAKNLHVAFSDRDGVFSVAG